MAAYYLRDNMLSDTDDSHSEPKSDSPPYWWQVCSTIVQKHFPDWEGDRTAGQYRSLIAELKATVKAHPEWKNPPWGELVFGCLGVGLRDWLKVAPDDGVLQPKWVGLFYQDEWEEARIRKGLPISHKGSVLKVASWRRTVQVLVDAHLPEPRRLRAVRVYRAMIAEIAAVMAAHPDGVNSTGKPRTTKPWAWAPGIGCK